MKISNQKLMNTEERKINASPEELEKIQEIDYRTQMDGESFYHIYLDSDSLTPPKIEKSFQ
ncbi:MAG: hypothetical protein CXT78_14975 [Thaumarchaeota archaeon]|nr:MAG: hypothetical protein CXT78_14975 [Nitrososphaerota archaeon]